MDEERVEVTVMDTVEKIGNDASDLAARTQAGVQGALEKASAVAQDVSAAAPRLAPQAGEIIKGVACNAANQAGEAANALYRQGANAQGYVSRYVAEQPIAALLIAAAFGYGIGYLVHRREQVVVRL
jgi:ElaB/YqjD/DUF883 family membrane-anchored ribosome-binding protein